MGANRHHAVRPWPALFAFADHRTVARDVVHAHGLGRGALRAADRAQLVLALGGRLGAHRRDAVRAVRWRAYRGGNQAGLPRDSGAARAAPARTCARTGAGALGARRRAQWLAVIVRPAASLARQVVARAAMATAA